MADSPLFKRWRERASEAVGDLLKGEKPSDAIGAALRQVQKGRRALDESAAKALGALGLATQEDLERVSQRVGKLRKRLQALLDGLE